MLQPLGDEKSDRLSRDRTYRIGTAVFLVMLIVLALAQRGAESTPTVTQSPSTTQAIPGPEDYLPQFGGDESVYRHILSLTGCVEVRAEIDKAKASFSQASPGSAERTAASGYVRAATEHFQNLECGSSGTSGGSSNTPSVPAGIGPDMRNISGWVSDESDCDNLQSWFNGAANYHDRASEAGDLPAMRWLTDLMGRIDNRLRFVGCYS